MTKTDTAPDKHGNAHALEGCDRCSCGCKYWEGDRCVDCGMPVVRVEAVVPGPFRVKPESIFRVEAAGERVATLFRVGDGRWEVCMEADGRSYRDRGPVEAVGLAAAERAVLATLDPSL